MYTYFSPNLLPDTIQEGLPVIPGIEFLGPDWTIDEGEQNHFTQIMFLLREHFYEECKDEIERHEFDKELILDLFEKDKEIYREHFDDGDLFVEKFPEMVDKFIKHYCLEI